MYLCTKHYCTCVSPYCAGWNICCISISVSITNQITLIWWQNDGDFTSSLEEWILNAWWWRTPIDHGPLLAHRESPKSITVSSCIYALFWTARIPLFASKFILKSGVTQCESWIAVTHTPSFFLIGMETLCAYAREDTVSVELNLSEGTTFWLIFDDVCCEILFTMIGFWHRFDCMVIQAVKRVERVVKNLF